jgi:hypothetical protein
MPNSTGGTAQVPEYDMKSPSTIFGRERPLLVFQNLLIASKQPVIPCPVVVALCSFELMFSNTLTRPSPLSQLQNRDIPPLRFRLRYLLRFRLRYLHLFRCDLLLNFNRTVERELLMRGVQHLG